jgi:putative membrane protein
MRRTLLTLGVLVLAAAWLGPLPARAAHSFAAHMTVHMAVVAVAAPLLAIGAAGSPFDLARAAPRLFAPIQASLVELLVVWAWHMPALHEAARQHTYVLVIEQATFLAAGFLLWIAACGGDRSRAGAGLVALLFTSMHMTLLGALFALAPRPLFHHGGAGVATLSDQHLGGAIMLLIGGASYLAGAMWLMSSVLRVPNKRLS